MKPISVFLIVVIVLLISPAAATTEATKVWTKQQNTQVSTVALDGDGSVAYFGEVNGTVGAYNSAGLLLWATALNASVVKIVKSPESDYLVAMTSINESVLIHSGNGSIAGMNFGIPLTDSWIKSVDIGKDGRYYLTVYDNSTYIRYLNQPVASNISVGGHLKSSVWLNGTYCPDGSCFVISKAGNNTIWKWIQSDYTAWGEANPLRIAYNADDLLWANYPNRKNMTVPNEGGVISFRLSKNTSFSETGSNLIIPETDYSNIKRVRVVTNGTYTDISTNRTEIKPITSLNSPPFSQPPSVTNFTAPMIGSYNFAEPVWNNSRLCQYFPAIAGSNITCTNNDRTWQVINTTGYAGSAYIHPVTYNGALYFVGSSALDLPYGLWGVSTDGNTVTILSTNLTEVPILNPSARYSQKNGCASNSSGIMCVGGLGYTDDPIYNDVWVTTTPQVIPWTKANESTSFGKGAVQLITFKDAIYAIQPNSTNSVWKCNNFATGAFMPWNASNPFHNTNNGKAAASPGDEVVIYVSDDSTIEYSTDLRTWWMYDDPGNPTTGYSIIAFNQATGNFTRTYGSATASSTYVLNLSLLQDRAYATYEPYYQIDFQKVVAGTTGVHVYYGNATGSEITINTSIVQKQPREISTGSMVSEPVPVIQRISQNVSAALAGSVQTMDIPEAGGWVAIGTDNPMIYHQQLASTGFGTQYSGAASAGASQAISLADAAAFSVEGRSLLTDIYQIDGTQKGTYTTGGTVNSVDISQKNALWVVSGGGDGKFYIFSKDSSSAWYVYYNGDSGSEIKSVAVDYYGNFALVGRSDGSLELYAVQTEVSSTQNVYLTVMQGGYTLPSAPVSISYSASYPYVWVDVLTGVTDAKGRIGFLSTLGAYYRVTVGGHTEIIQAVAGVYEYIIQVPYTPSVPASLDFWSVYDTTSDVVTNYYYDKNDKTANVEWTTTNTTGGVVVGHAFVNYSGTALYNYANMPTFWDNTSAKVSMVIYMDDGTVMKNTFVNMGKANTTTAFPSWVDADTRNGIALVLLLIVAGLFSYASGPIGAFITAITAGGLWYWHLLTMDVTTISFCIVMAALGMLGRKAAEP